MNKYKNKRIVVIRQRGQPDKGQLPDGRTVHKIEKVFAPEWGGFIPCAPYSDHFIYEAPRDLIGSKWRCSCGAVAVIVGATGYIQDASPQGKLVVCLEHAQTGIHFTGGSKWQ
jgi:hypothetical protein